jgi:hypothetical protein
MVESLGIDIVEVKRVKTLMEKWGDRFFSPLPWGRGFALSVVEGIG